MTTVIDDEARWAAIRPDFEAGLLSLREISKRHSTPEWKRSHAAIDKYAQQHGWTRSLAARIQAKAEEKAQREIAREQDSRLTDATEHQVIEANAQRIAEVRTVHRRSAARLIKITEAQLKQLEAMKPEDQLLAYKVSKSIADQLRAAVEIEAGTYGFSKDTPEPPAEDQVTDVKEVARGLAFLLTRAVIAKAQA